MTVDPEFAQVRAAPRGGFVGFLSGIPGLLTAAAAVITALSGLYFTQLGPPPEVPASPEETIYLINFEAEPIPEGTAETEVDAASVDSGFGAATVEDETNQLIADCGAGFTDACNTLLDMLVVECHDGDGISCDVLYEVTEVGSDYEAYGATCGGRFAWEYAGTCSEL